MYSIGVVIPVFNCEQYVVDALDSVVSQQRPPDQLVVVDDGSTDNSVARVNEWAARSRPTLRFDLIRSENKGVSAARNLGIHRLDTELVALLDSDDYFHSNHLMTLERAFTSHPKLDLCFGDVRILDPAAGLVVQSFLSGKRVEDLSYLEDDTGLRLIQEPLYVSLLSGSYIPTASNLFRRSAALGIGGFDERLQWAEDRDFWIRLSRTGQFAYCRNVLATKREHLQNSSRPALRVRAALSRLRQLQGLLQARAALKLSIAEEDATRREIREAVTSLLYCASSAGLRQYGRCLAVSIGGGALARALDPRHFIRALAQSFKGSSTNW